jgi:hypothetical protein
MKIKNEIIFYKSSKALFICSPIHISNCEQMIMNDLERKKLIQQLILERSSLYSGIDRELFFG